MDAIAKAYARRIERGTISLADVPAQMRERVEQILAAREGA